MWKSIPLILLVLATPLAGAGEKSVAGQLDPELASLLRQEMRALEEAMGKVPGHLVRGNWEQVETISRNIHDSFILKQEMSPQQKQSLKEILPETFRDMDRQFHQQAARLAEQAGERDAHGAIATYRDMLDACVNCHREFALERFPALERPR